MMGWSGGAHTFRTVLRKSLRTLAYCAGMVTLLGGAVGARLSSDETVVFFPAYATQGAAGGPWRVHLHAWVFELEPESLLRSKTLKVLASRLEATDSDLASELFRKRAQYFIADNERGKEIDITIGNRKFVLGPTEPNGHLVSSFELDADFVTSAAEQYTAGSGSYLFADVNLKSVATGPSRVKISLISPQGISVISDLDDTIKISEVGNKRSLLTHTFLKEYAAVPGMSSLYARWASQGVSFSYITASPWQLFVPVEDFLRKTGFPEGTLSMKSFRWKDSSFFDLFVNNGKYKRPLAEEILSRLPHRSFYLVGDSGENDIELYCSLAEVYPNQIKGIFIRRTTAATVESTKKDGVCRTVLDKLQFFDSPTQLPSVLLP